MALASRAGGVRQQYYAPSAEQAPLYMPINTNYPGLVQLHQKPPIYFIHDFLTDEECAALIETAGPLLQRSKTHAVSGARARTRPRHRRTISTRAHKKSGGHGGQTCQAGVRARTRRGARWRLELDGRRSTVSTAATATAHPDPRRPAPHC